MKFVSTLVKYLLLIGVPACLYFTFFYLGSKRSFLLSSLLPDIVSLFNILSTLCIDFLLHTHIQTKL
jgi:hypothetical protein